MKIFSFVILAFFFFLLSSHFASAVLFSSAPSLADVFKKIMNLLLTIFGSLGVIALVVSGIFYLTSAGDKERATQAKKYLIYAIIGLGIGIGSSIIISTLVALIR